MSRRADLIVAEAARLFAQRGYGATGIDDVGAACGISGPAIYHHFAGKQALLAAMLIDISQRLLDEGRRCVEPVDPDADPDVDPEVALVRLVDAQVAFAIREPDLIVVQGRDLHHLEPVHAQRVRLLQRQYIDVWVGVLAVQHCGLPRNRLGAAVRATIGLINSTPHLGRIDRASLAPMLSSMALAALAAAQGVEG